MHFSSELFKFVFINVFLIIIGLASNQIFLKFSNRLAKLFEYMSDIITKDGAFILNVYFKITLICSEFFSPLVLVLLRYG